MPYPEDYKLGSNPPYVYYIYYMYANLYSLNKLREALGMSACALRQCPHGCSLPCARHAPPSTQTRLSSGRTVARAAAWTT